MYKDLEFKTCAAILPWRSIFSTTSCVVCVCVFITAEVQPNDLAVQHQRAKELLQLTEWMSAVGQGGKEVLVSTSTSW